MKLIKILYVIFFILISPISKATEFGTEEEAKAMLDRAINLIKFNELFALEQITEGSGGFKLKDLYPFCANSKGILVGHPVNVGFDSIKFY